jgi:hypothetical protein
MYLENKKERPIWERSLYLLESKANLQHSNKQVNRFYILKSLTSLGWQVLMKLTDAIFSDLPLRIKISADLI